MSGNGIRSSSGAGLPGSAGIDQLSLRVRVGWLTRTEVVPLDQMRALSGPSQQKCGLQPLWPPYPPYSP